MSQTKYFGLARTLAPVKTSLWFVVKDIVFNTAKKLFAFHFWPKKFYSPMNIFDDPSEILVKKTINLC